MINGKLQGYIIDKEGDTSEIKKIEEKDWSVAIYFTFNHLDVNLLIRKKKAKIIYKRENTLPST